MLSADDLLLHENSSEGTLGHEKLFIFQGLFELSGSHRKHLTEMKVLMIFGRRERQNNKEK